MSPEGFIATVAEFDSVPMPGSIVELDGTIVAVNRATARFLERPPEQVIGRKVWELAPGMEHAWKDIITAAQAGVHHGEMTVATPLGPRAIHYVGEVRAFGDRSVLVAFGIEAAAIETARALEEQARRAESLGLVAGGIAHDFNNQLVSVLAEASYAREDKSVSLAVSEALRRIEAAAQRMAMLTRQLLAYAGRGRFVLEVFEPDDLVRDLRSELEPLIDRNATLVAQLGATHVSINVDRTQLREVISNLVLNASDALAGKQGAIKISTGSTTHQGTSCWRLEVSDPGIGMDPATLGRIFDPFFTTKRDHHGLGLSVALGIVRRFGGEIRASSELNKGSSFVVVLPTAVAKAALPKRARTMSESAISLRAVTVLVADDESSVRATLRRLLERRGAVVVLAGDGDEAEVALDNGRYDLVLLDVMMPKQTGYQLMPKVRRKQPTAKVIVMSGYTDGDGSPNGTENDPDGFLEKPFSTKQFDDMVDGVLGT